MSRKLWLAGLTMAALVVLGGAAYLVLRPACGCEQSVDARVGQMTRVGGQLDIALTAFTRSPVMTDGPRSTLEDLLVTHWRIHNVGNQMLVVAQDVRADDGDQSRVPDAHSGFSRRGILDSEVP